MAGDRRGKPIHLTCAKPQISLPMPLVQLARGARAIAVRREAGRIVVVIVGIVCFRGRKVPVDHAADVLVV
jgi:hypothetical protein